MKTIEVAAGVIRDQCGCVLICKRKGELEGLWEFPGGKREAGESFAECLQRELMEELSLPIKAGDELCEILHEDGQKRIKLVFVNATASNALPLSLRVHADAIWSPIQALDRYTFCPADSLFVNKGLL